MFNNPKPSFNISWFVFQSFSFVESSYFILVHGVVMWVCMKAVRSWHRIIAWTLNLHENLYI